MNHECRTALTLALKFAMSTAADGAVLIAQTPGDPRHNRKQRVLANVATREFDRLDCLATHGFETDAEFAAYLTRLYETLSELAKVDLDLTTLGIRRDYPR